MNKGSLMPKIRFVNFKGDWEKCKLGEISTLSSSKRIHLSDYVESGVPFYRGSEITNGGISGQNKLFITESLYIKIKEKYGVPIEGDLLITAVGTLGNVWKVDNSKFYYKDGNLIRISNLSVTSNYLSSYLSDNPGKKILLDSAAGSNQKALTMVKMRDIEIPVSSFEEQTKIGEFFMQLDDIIILQQQLLDDHKQLKKAMLQKMFPQKGESVPRVRFNQFKYEWEEKKLSSLFEIRNIKQVPTTEAPLMAFTSTGGVESKGERFNREFLVKNKNKTYKRTELNDLIYSSNNLDVGAIARNKYGTAVISDVYEIFKTQDTVTPLFSEIFIKNKRFLNKVLKYRQGALYGQYRIYASDFLSVDTLIPNFKEQEKIGDFFKQLDETIVLHEKKLETYQELKKAMLQKMFV